MSCWPLGLTDTPYIAQVNVAAVRIHWDNCTCALTLVQICNKHDPRCAGGKISLRMAVAGNTCIQHSQTVTVTWSHILKAK